MFTQCPDCQTTFRVSAEVLKQADGRVRCGGCGNAFDALENLSHDDASRAASQDKTSTEPKSDQNKQLLETLDKLAGPEVELEDTGTEWRVLEESEEGETDPDAIGSVKTDGEGDAEEQASETAAVHSRKSDLPKPVPDAQESLDLPEMEPQQTKSSERRYDDNTILPDDFGKEDDLDELPFLESETPKRRASDREAAQDTSEFDDAQVDLALGEPDEWIGLLDEVGDEEAGTEVAAEASAEEEPEAAEEAAADDEPPGEDMPSDINTQFLLQAEEMGLDTGSYPVVEDEEDEGNENAELGETDAADTSDDEDEGGEEAGEDDDPSDICHEEIEELAELDIEEELAVSDGKDEVATEEYEEIDDEIATTVHGGKDVSKIFDEDSPTVENIIMEGELVGDSINQKRMMDTEAAGKFEDLERLKDTYSLSRGTIRGGRRAGDSAGYAARGSAVVLASLLIGQIMHQSRQTLATYGAFNHTIGSIYRVLGKPVTPEWDIRGWRFEATNGNVDEEEDLLTIYSRIANKSSQALPYPLLHISLTDRWEDIIGSRALEPNEYLAGDLDPRRPVPSGENFTAVITIESPSVDATGFRLTACYRISPGRVRCADEHFKD